MKHHSALLAALLLCVSAHGQTTSSSSTANSESPPKENTLDSARRELKELPAAERSRDVLAKPSSLNSSSLPSLALPGETSARPDPNQPPSATWLQDSIDQVGSATANRRRAADSAAGRDRDDRPGGYKPAELPNPFGQYLEQWISPRDLELLRAGQENKRTGSDAPPAATASNRQLSLKPLSGETPQADSFAPAVASNPVAPMLGTTRNPYIDDADPVVVQPALNSLFSQPVPGQNPADRARAPGLAPLTVTTSPATSKQPASLRPATPPTTAPAQPQRPPTAPIVDDRKYFPQLRRF